MEWTIKNNKGEYLNKYSSAMNMRATSDPKLMFTSDEATCHRICDTLNGGPTEVREWSVQPYWGEKTELEKKFDERYDQVKNQLVLLTDLVNGLASEHRQEPTNWGILGNLGHIHEKLGNILEGFGK